MKNRLDDYYSDRVKSTPPSPPHLEGRDDGDDETPDPAVQLRQMGCFGMVAVIMSVALLCHAAVEITKLILVHMGK